MRRELFVGFLLAAAVTLVYWPVHSYPFVLLDDQAYVSENPSVNKGLTAEGFRFAFTGVTVANWHPLTTLTHMLDCQLFGAEEKNAGRHHLTNVALHVANTLLLFIVLRLMTGAVWRSGLVAALFGLHPLHVESVAWISERKDVLSMFFFMLLLLAYRRYAQRPSFLRYATVFVLLAMGLMSKPMLVTAPLVLLLLDFWPLGRMRLRPVAVPAPVDEEVDEDEAADSDAESEDEEVEASDEAAEQTSDKADEESGEKEPDEEESDEFREAADAARANADGRTGPGESLRQWKLGTLIAEKIPLFVLVALSAFLTMVVQGTSGAMGMLGQNLTLPARVENAICSYGLYMEKVFWPRPLAAIYPYTTHKLIDVLIIGLALGAITAAAYYMARVKPYLVVGWWWYLITLVPVIGVVQVGMQSMADRYTYIPLIGLFIIVAWGGAELIEDWTIAGKARAAVAVAAVLGGFSWLTWQQVTTWSSSEALFSHAAAVEQNNYVALDWLGTLYWQQGRLDDAQEKFEAILKIESDPRLHIEGGLEPAHRALGVLLAVKSAHAAKPSDRETLLNHALAELDKAINLQKKQPDARRHKAWLLATYPDDRFRNGRKAVELAREALDLSRHKQAEFWDTLAVAQAETLNFPAAIEAEQKAIDAARQRHFDEMVPALEERLEMFKAGMRYHAEPRRPTRL